VGTEIGWPCSEALRLLSAVEFTDWQTGSDPESGVEFDVCYAFLRFWVRRVGKRRKPRWQLVNLYAAVSGDRHDGVPHGLREAVLLAQIRHRLEKGVMLGFAEFAEGRIVGYYDEEKEIPQREFVDGPIDRIAPSHDPILAEHGNE